MRSLLVSLISVAQGIAEHYLPRGAGDKMPQSLSRTESWVLAIAWIL